MQHNTYPSIDNFLDLDLARKCNKHFSIEFWINEKRDNGIFFGFDKSQELTKKQMWQTPQQPREVLGVRRHAGPPTGQW